MVSKCHQEKIKQVKMIKRPGSAILVRIVREVISEEVTFE